MQSHRGGSADERHKAENNNIDSGEAVDVIAASLRSPRAAGVALTYNPLSGPRLNGIRRKEHSKRQKPLATSDLSVWLSE